MFSCEFCKIFKNTLLTEHLWMTASNFIRGVFFIFSIIKNFRLEKSQLVENCLKVQQSSLYRLYFQPGSKQLREPTLSDKIFGWTKF